MMADQAPVLYSAAQLTEMLSSILHSTDNNERRNVEAAVVRSLATPANLVELVNVLCNNQTSANNGAAAAPAATPSAGVRQLAAVLLRKKIFSLWRSLDEAQQRELRGLLLAQLGNEPVRIVRFAIAHIVTRLAKADASQGGGGWPELQQAIRSAVEDPRVEMRELSMVLVYSFAEVFSEENALSGLAAESVIRGLADADRTVQTVAVKAAAMLMPSLESHAMVYQAFLQQLVPQCLAILVQHAAPVASANDGGEASGTSASLCVGVLDLAEQLLGELSAKKHADLLVLIAQRLLEVLGNRQCHARVRQNCGVTLASLVSAKPKFVVSHGLLQPMVECCERLMSEDATISLPDEAMMEGDDDDEGEGMNGNGRMNNDDDNDDDDDDDVDMLNVQSSCMTGAYLLSSLATAAPSRAVTAALLPFITAVTSGTPAAGLDVLDPLVRKSAMLSLACLAEGNASYLRKRVGFVLEVVRAYFEDSHPVAREAAAFALSNFCLRLQPEILTHHAELFPMVVPLLKDTNDLVRCRAADALDMLCENVAEELEPYVPTVLPAVVEAIGNSSLQTQKALCGVISSMGMTRCPSIIAYAPSVLELLKQPFTVPATPETIPLRAQATETVGIMGVAMGKAAFEPFFPVFMQYVVRENLALGSAALREQSFGFLANVCELLKEDFLPFLDDSIAAALNTVTEDTATYKNKHLLAKAEVPFALGDDLQQQQQQNGEANDHDEDGDEDAAEIHMRVRTADVEEKCSAINCIGVFAETLLTSFGLERVQRCCDAFGELEGHFYPNVRSNLMIAYAKLLRAAHGQPVVARSVNEDTLQQSTRDLLDDFVHHSLLPTIHEEMEKEVVAAACEAMQSVLEFFGPQCFPFGPDSLVKEAILFLRQKKACQLAVDFDPEDSEQDDIDGEDELFREADAAIAANHNASWRDVVRPEMVAKDVHLKEDHDEDVMDSAMDMLESLVKAYGADFAPYVPYLIPLLQLYLDANTRDAGDLVMASGTLAILLESTGPAIAAHCFDLAIHAAFCILLTSDESTARGNSCYLLRVLIQSCPDRFINDTTALQQTLQALWSVAAAAATSEDSNRNSGAGATAAAVDEIPEAVDNAISATCSLVRCCSLNPSTGQPAPLLAMLPTVVPPMLLGVPMRLDKAENANAIQTLLFLLAHPAVAASVTANAAWLPDLVRCVANVCVSRTVELAEKTLLVQQGVAVFAAAHGEAWQAARQAAQLNADQLAALQEAGY